MISMTINTTTMHPDVFWFSKTPFRAWTSTCARSSKRNTISERSQRCSQSEQRKKSAEGQRLREEWLGDRAKFGEKPDAQKLEQAKTVIRGFPSSWAWLALGWQERASGGFGRPFLERDHLWVPIGNSLLATARSGSMLRELWRNSAQGIAKAIKKNSWSVLSAPLQLASPSQHGLD